MSKIIAQARSCFKNLVKRDKPSAGKDQIDVDRNITKARGLFEDLDDQKDFKDIKSVTNMIGSALEDAGVGYAALDPNGMKTDNEMKAEVEKRVSLVYITKARKCFEVLGFLEDGEDVIITMKLIRSALEDAGVGYAALDPNGMKTDDEMKAEVKKRASLGYIIKARIFFETLDRDMFDRKKTITNMALIGSFLETAGVGYEALDPTGKKTADEMKAEINERASIFKPAKPPSQNGCAQNNPPQPK
ncbi:MAG: hypothetical protein PHS57_07990 [Alphaproteobacteria bacterium]|nr:hypothetical protein [Alphaproteobacteria bacterium]